MVRFIFLQDPEVQNSKSEGKTLEGVAIASSLSAICPSSNAHS